VHDGRSCLSGESYEYEYVATCEDPGTVPLWGLLTYNASIPGGATIEFWGRNGVGATDAEAATDAAAKSYSLLLSADSSLEVCALDGTLPCPLDLTEALGLGSFQGHHLDLKIVLNPDAAEPPFLSNWDITYSCVFDQ
jgi:hypothetical protein